MDPVKIAGVVEWPTPGSKKEVQSFLGFTNFYCRFIQGFSDLARPLFDLTWNNSDWHWEAAEWSAFEAIHKHVVTHSHVSGRQPTFPGGGGQLGFCH
jgi:hypothetical protein